MNYPELEFHKLDKNLEQHMNYVFELGITILKLIRTTFNFDTKFYKDSDYLDTVKTLYKYRGGNCVSMAKLAVLLFSICNINASLIPSTIPQRIIRPGQEPLCHVACCVNIDNKAYIILDPAFYFLEPIVAVKNNIIDPIRLYGKSYYVRSRLHNTKNYIYKFSSSQKIPQHTDYIICNADNGDKWRYFIIGISNADETITANHRDVFIDNRIFVPRKYN